MSVVHVLQIFARSFPTVKAFLLLFCFSIISLLNFSFPNVKLEIHLFALFQVNDIYTRLFLSFQVL